MQKKQNVRGGFALPTVLIASVVMLMIMALAVSSVAAVRTTLKTQYYEQLAKAAGEAGVAYAKSCLAKNGNVPLWTDNKPLKPSTDCAGNALLSPEVQVLVVAGGGGGGNNHAGGGGGGGVAFEEAYQVGKQSYNVVVGAGGSGGTAVGAAGTNGSNSSFGGTISTLGGGGGGGRIGSDNPSMAKSGGSGGGGTGTRNPADSLQAAKGASGTVGQGNDGGSGSIGVTAGNGGGGGGAGGPGATATGAVEGAGTSGAGGIGYLSDISGAMIYYGAGGSGGRWSAGAVGQPGITGGGMGGNAGGIAGAPGSPNTGGGGGGGAGGSGLTPPGGNGGSGVVVVRYANNGSIVATASGVYSTYNSGPYKVFRFTGNGAFAVSETKASSCPTDPRCSVMVNNNLRSSFSVGKPILDEEGKAAAIANTGYVELLRESNGEVWRTYRQPSVQAAIVPDLCSGAATTGLGWSNAVKATTQEALPNAPSATTITLSNGGVDAGKMYYRKDFVVTNANTYSVALMTTSSQDKVELFVGGIPVVTSQGSLATGSVSLSPGCYTATVRHTNKTITPRPSAFTAAIRKDGAAPIMTTDTTWRVSAGSAVHFSSSEYYADPDVWTPVSDYNATNSTQPTWGSKSSDIYTRMISTTHSSCGASCPQGYTFLRDDTDFILSSTREVRISSLCDDRCAVFLDGNQIIEDSPWPEMSQQTFTLTEGSHRLAARLQNNSVGPSNISLALIDATTGEVLARTDNRWLATNQWFGGNGAGVELFSNEASFIPSPAEIAEQTTLEALVVAGGGGGTTNAGGGGGGGGVRYFGEVPVSTGAKAVTIGGGGAGSTVETAVGATGAVSQYESTTYRALGGGGGAPRTVTLRMAGGGSGVVGSGGGGAGAYSVNNHPGGAGTAGHGSAGGAGTAPDAVCQARGGGGGGAGGLGMSATAGVNGNGGAGYITYMTGTRLAVGGGGGGAATCATTVGSATDGGAQTVSGVGATNRGGGGSVGGAGGSGIVILRYKTGSITATGGTVSTWNDYTIHTFTTSGTFNVTAVQ